MRAEIVSMEMAVDIDQAWVDNWHKETNARNMAVIDTDGEEARVTVKPFGGLAIVYGLDRKIPDENNSAHDMVTWIIGNMKLVFTAEEWATLVAKTDKVIDVGRVNWKAAFGE